MTSKFCGFALLFIALLISTAFPSSSSAQFSGDFGSISGSVKWGSETLMATGDQGAKVTFTGNTTGYQAQVTATPNYSTGVSLPPDTYTVKAYVKPYMPSVTSWEIGSQTITVASGQSVTGINFDASSVTGLVKGTLTVNGTPANGWVQFCSSVETDPCPFGVNSFNQAHGPFYRFENGSFKTPIPPGSYRIHVKTNDNVSVGIVPITISAGQLLEDPSVQFSFANGSISGSVKWGSETIYATQGQGAIVKFTGNSTNFQTEKSATPNYNTGLTLPPDTYTVKAFLYPVKPTNAGFEIGSQTITLASGQSVTGVNFDASATTGLVKGSLTVNGSPASGWIQFCSPVLTSPCPFGNNSFDQAHGSYYRFDGGNFKVPVPPGSYRVHVKTVNNVSVGIVPITISAGQLLDDPSLQLSYSPGTISGSVKWGAETLLATGDQGAKVTFTGTTSGFQTQSTATPNYSTGATLPQDTYTVRAYVKPYMPAVTAWEISSQAVAISSGQSVANLNFDASIVTGLVRGTLTVNGSPASGWIQFCSPVLTDPCPFGVNSFNQAHGPFYKFENGTFKAPIPPGSYRVHVKTFNNVSVGIVPITINTGQIIELTTYSLNVPVGSNVPVTLPGGITVIFPQVTNAGSLTVTTTSHPQGGQPPSQYRFLGTYYELNTTATYTGPITVKFSYNDADVTGQEQNLRLFHWDGNGWQNITVPPVDTVNNIITGQSQTLSPFAIGDALNAVPTVNANGPYNVSEGSSINLTATGSDPENSTLSFAWDLDNNGSYETTGQNVTFSAAAIDGPASRTIRVQVTDEAALTATDTATVNINNAAPSLGTLTAPTEPVENDTDVNTSINFSDPAVSDTHTAVWNWGDGNTTTGTVTESNGSGNVTGVHQYSTAGTYTVKVTVTDNNGGVSDKTATVTIFVNQPPYVDPLSGGKINVGGTYTENSSFTDDNSTSWTATVDYGEGAGQEPLTLNPDKTYSLSHIYNTPGEYTVTVVVRDDKLATGTTMATVTVNGAPQVAALSGATLTTHETYSENGSFTDPDSTMWTATVDYGDGSGVQPLSINGSTFALQHDYATSGEYIVTVAVTDNQGATGSRTAPIVVKNQAPTLNTIGNKAVAEGQSLQFTVSASDPDGDSLLYSAANLPPGAAFNPFTRVFSWTPDFTQEGNYPDIEFTVTDDGSPMELDTELITITVGNINRAPIIDPVGSQAVLENETVTFTVSATDPDGDNITLSASNMPQGASFNPQTGTFLWTPTLSQSGNYVVTFNATDNGTPFAIGHTDVAITVGDDPTPTEQAQHLVDVVVTYNLLTNVENSYLANLKKVEKFIEDGKIEAAVNQLNTFISKVEDHYAAGTITQNVRNNLINLAQALLADLQ